MLTFWASHRWSGADLSTPFENIVTDEQTGSITAITVPDTTKSLDKGVNLPQVCAVMAATPGATITGAWSGGPAGGLTTMVNRGDTNAPNLGSRYQGIARETPPPGNAGAISGATCTLSRAASNTFAINRVLRPAVAGTAPTRVTGNNLLTTSSTVSVTFASMVAGHLLVADLWTDDPTATITPPAGWTAGTAWTFGGGTVQRFHRTAADSTTLSFDFTIAPGAPAVPTNTVQPTVSGTASIGSTLTCTTGTWTGSPTGYAYQWMSDGADIPGATSSTYIVQAADNGHVLTCRVVASNATGDGDPAVSSNSVTIPAKPVNSTLPAISPAGPYNTDDFVTCSDGSWSGSPTITKQWYRVAAPITGETSDTYQLQVTDEGANIFCRVTATNGGGSTTADSNIIVPESTTPLSDASFLWYYSGGTGNTDKDLSIGGGRGGTYPGGLSQLFDRIIGTVAASGGVFYRGVYVRNTHATATAAACKAYIAEQLVHTGLHLAIAVPVEAAGVDLPALASQTTPPSGVTWTTAEDFASGEDFGDLGPGVRRGLWVRLTVDAGTGQDPEEDFDVAVEGSAA